MSQKSSVKKRPKMNEIALIRRARLEDISAYEELVRRYYGRIYGLIYGLTGNCDDAEFVTQEVFIKAWKAIGQFKEQASFFTWIYRIAVNRTARFRKKNIYKRTIRFEEFEPGVKETEACRVFQDPDSVLSGMTLGEFQKTINEALLELPYEYRAAVVMSDVQTMSSADIAGIMICSEHTVSSRVSYAREALAKTLAGVEEADENKKEVPNLDMEQLLSMKRFELPDEEEIEKRLPGIMEAVSVAHRRPSLLLFPDKSLGWMLAQPRYGIAALLLLFLGLHTCGRTLPKDQIPGPVADNVVPGAGIVNLSETNEVVIPPGISVGQPDYQLNTSSPTGFPVRSVDAP